MQTKWHVFYWILIICLVVGVGLCFHSPLPETPESDLDFAVFVGGGNDSAFAATVAKGATQAGRDLNVNVHCVWSDWENEKMLLQFKEVLSEDVDGIAMMGHPGEKALRPLVDEALRKGVLVTTLNVDLPAIEAEHRSVGFGYAGQEIQESGRRLANATIRTFDLKPGDKVLLTGVKQYPIRGQRTTAAEEVLKEAKLDVTYIQDNGDLEVFAAEVVDFLKKNPDTKAIIDDALAAFMAKTLKNAGFEPGQFPVSGFDLSSEAVALMKEGYLHLLSDQQPYLQGYLAVLQLTMSKRYGFSGLHVDTGSGFVHRDNLIETLKWVREGVR